VIYAFQTFHYLQSGPDAAREERSYDVAGKLRAAVRRAMAGIRGFPMISLLVSTKGPAGLAEAWESVDSEIRDLLIQEPD
jgi:hypothetical protein